MKEHLLYSIKYRQASEAYRKQFSNGCGPTWFPAVFSYPLNKIFGNSVCEACNIHDFDYAMQIPRHIADRRFKKNPLILARGAARDNRMLLSRYLVSYLYYFAVRLGGVFSY